MKARRAWWQYELDQSNTMSTFCQAQLPLPTCSGGGA